MSVAPDVAIENVPSKANYVAPKAAGMAGASAKAKVVGGSIFALVLTATGIAIPFAISGECTATVCLNVANETLCTETIVSCASTTTTPGTNPIASSSGATVR